MLSREDNERLTRVGPLTPMGRLLRRYWMPIAAVSEFDTCAVMPVRLMGEDLVLYRDRQGCFGLLGRRCPHRSADLACGFVEDHGLRCHYHGWLFDNAGACIERPYEDALGLGRQEIRIPGYRVDVKAGLVWAYLGPEPPPLVPDWEPYSWENGFRQIVFADVPCNWFQCQENSIDPVHFEWLHANWTQRLRQTGDHGAYSPRHLKTAFEEFEYGFVYRRLREGMSETNPLWTVGRVCLWPNALFTGGHFEWRVPVDDENTRSVTWSFTRVPKDCEPFVQDGIPAWHGPVRDSSGQWITSHVMNQDFVAWASQGRIADRSQERLGPGDAGIIALRKRFLDELAALDAGRDPKGTIRDPAVNHRVALPVADLEALSRGITREEMARHPFMGTWLEGGYPFQAGQPEAIRREYEQAMGMGRAST